MQFDRVLGCLGKAVIGFVVLSMPCLAANAKAPPKKVTTPVAPVVAQAKDAKVTEDDLHGAMQILQPLQLAAVKEHQASSEGLVKELLVRRRLANLAKSSGATEKSAVVARLRLTEERVLAELLVEEAENKAVADEKSIERMARDEYRAFPERYKDDGYQIRHLLVRPQPSCERDARAFAEGLLARLKAGEDFEALAKKYSDDTGSGAKGGDLGRVTLGKTVKPFEEAFLKLKQAGELSDIVETQFGFHIIQMVALPTGKLRPFEEVKAGLMDEFRAKRKAEARRALLEPMLDPATMTVDTEALRSAVGGTWPQ